VSMEDGLFIIDVSNPVNPVLMGSFDTPGQAIDIAVSGNYAYVADAGSGLHIINVSNPANPTLVGTYNTPGQAYGVFLSGNFAYVADGYNIGSLHVIDVSHPDYPVLVMTYDTPGSTRDIYVAGDLLYVADRFSVLILDFTFVGIEDEGPLPKAAALSQNYPNPFNAQTQLKFGLAEKGRASLAIYNLLGERVATLVDGVLPEGERSLTWNAGALPSGVYFARLEALGRSETIKLVLLK